MVRYVLNKRNLTINKVECDEFYFSNNFDSSIRRNGCSIYVMDVSENEVYQCKSDAKQELNKLIKEEIKSLERENVYLQRRIVSLSILKTKLKCGLENKDAKCLYSLEY